MHNTLDNQCVSTHSIYNIHVNIIHTPHCVDMWPSEWTLFTWPPFVYFLREMPPVTTHIHRPVFVVICLLNCISSQHHCSTSASWLAGSRHEHTCIHTHMYTYTHTHMASTGRHINKSGQRFHRHLVRVLNHPCRRKLQLIAKPESLAFSMHCSLVCFTNLRCLYGSSYSH